jgi:hypothetical protein
MVFVWWNLDVDYMTILMQSQNLKHLFADIEMLLKLELSQARSSRSV